MLEIDADTAADYLRSTGRVPKGADFSVRELSGGVSNIVLRVDVDGQPPFVIKQCRERLRVAMEWRAPLDRIWTESATLGVLQEILPEGTVPRVLFEDRPNYLFAMTCAPDDAVTWKSLLMEGSADPEIAGRLGTILGTIHEAARTHPALRGTLADTSLFEELRVDPYYRTVARRHPDLAPRIEALIAAMDRPEAERTLVLGDFSPKNILVHAGGLVLLDFEMCARRRPGLRPRLLPDAPRPQGDPRDRGRILGRSVLHRPDTPVLGRLPRASRARARGDGRPDSPGQPAHGGLLPGPGSTARARSSTSTRAARHCARSFARRALEVEPSTWGEFMHLFRDAMEGGSAWPH